VNLVARVEGGGGKVALDGREVAPRAATAVLVHGGSPRSRERRAR
jgi:hypothetical protein